MFKPNAVLDTTVLEQFHRTVSSILSDEAGKYAQSMDDAGQKLTVRDEFGNVIWTGTFGDAMTHSSNQAKFMGQVKIDADNVSFYK